MICAVGNANGHVKIARPDAVVKAHRGIFHGRARSRKPQIGTFVLPRWPSVSHVPATCYMRPGPSAQPPASVGSAVPSTGMAHSETVLAPRKVKTDQNRVSTLAKVIKIVAAVV